jgi:hypothetical protein
MESAEPTLPMRTSLVWESLLDYEGRRLSVGERAPGVDFTPRAFDFAFFFNLPPGALQLESIPYLLG